MCCKSSLISVIYMLLFNNIWMKFVNICYIYYCLIISGLSSLISVIYVIVE